MWGYFDLVFESDTKKGDVGGKLVLTNLDTGSRVKVNTQPGSTLPNNFIISPTTQLKLGNWYSLYIPAGTIIFNNGTTFEEEIRIIFKMADTVVVGRVSGSSFDAMTPIALIAEDGTRFESVTRGTNEFFVTNVPGGKYQFEIDGEIINTITVVENTTNKVTVAIK